MTSTRLTRSAALAASGGLSTSSSPPGWYPDPLGKGRLRLFDSARWTGRTRPDPKQTPRNLPTAALRLRARLLAAADRKYLLRGDYLDTTIAVRIPRPRPLPSISRRNHNSGSVTATISALLSTMALLASVYFAWQLWGTDLYGAYQQSRLSNQLAAIEQQQYVPPDPVTPPPVAGDKEEKPKPPEPKTITNRTDVPADSQPVGRIRIPKIGLDAVFVMGTEVDDLKLGPGVWKWGVMPGDVGNATISGHRTTYSHPYRHLDDLTLGDKIVISIPGQKDTVYEMRAATIASPFDVGVTQQMPGVRLTLTTCNPVGSARERLVIEAEAISGPNAQFAVPRDQWKKLD